MSDHEANVLREAVRKLSWHYLDVSGSVTTPHAERPVLRKVSRDLWELLYPVDPSVTPLDADEAWKEAARETVIEGLAMDALARRPEEF